MWFLATPPVAISLSVFQVASAGSPPESPMMGQFPNAIGDKQEYGDQ
jgi:hypothetical protein